MPGLLKQLQKSKSSLIQGIDTVLIRPGQSGKGKSDGGLEDLADRVEGTAVEAERLLGELMAEAASASTKSSVFEKSEWPSKGTESGIRVVRRQQSASHSQVRAMRRDGLQPWWLSEQRRLSPLVESLINHAEADLVKVYGLDVDRYVTHGEMPPFEDAVPTAVSVAAEKCAGEFTVLKKDREVAQREILGIVAARGPLEALFQDAGVSDIFLDGPRMVKALRKGQTLETPFSFRSNVEFRLFIFGLLRTLQSDLTTESPIANGILADQWKSRVNAVHGSLIEGSETKVSIRIPRVQQVSFYDLLQAKVLPASLASWLAELMVSREANILVVGPTGGGKTLLATALLSAVNSDERVIVVETVPEISVPTGHMEKLIARLGGVHGENAVTQSDLVQAALSRSPHRIAIGEMRDEHEGRTFLHVLESGITGSLATLFGNSAEDGVWRLIDMIAATEQAPMQSIIRRVTRSLNVVISMTKVDNTPCLNEVAEVEVQGDGRFTVRQLVAFDGVQNGKRCWRLLADSSVWIDRVREKGITLMPGVGLLPLQNVTKESEPASNSSTAAEKV